MDFFGLSFEFEEGVDTDARLKDLAEYLGSDQFRLQVHSDFARVMWGQFTLMRKREMDWHSSGLKPLKPSTLESRARMGRPYGSGHPILDSLWHSITHAGRGSIYGVTPHKATVGLSGKRAEIMDYHRTGAGHNPLRDVMGFLPGTPKVMIQGLINRIGEAAAMLGLNTEFGGGNSALAEMERQFNA